VARADALQLLRALAPECAQIVFLDPPFNLGKKYGGQSASADQLPELDYLAYLQRIVSASAIVLQPGGSLYLYHIPRWAVRIAPHMGDLLDFQSWIAISMKNGYVGQGALYPAHYALLHYSKGKPSVVHRPKVPPLTCPHCGEFVKDYGGYKEHVENGVNLSDVWDDISPVRHPRYKHRDANELPMAIPKRAAQMSGSRGGLFVDPFAGTGTAAIAARTHGMKFVAGDHDQQSVDLISARLEALSVRRVRTGGNGSA
jgi:site-specific DNA-methyltransferase (adenine-specific)